MTVRAGEGKSKAGNDEIVRVLKEIGEYLDMQGVAFKPRAYAKAAETVEALSEQAGDIYARGGIKALKEIPGVGASIAETIEELIASGKSKHHEELRKKTPVDLSSLSRVEGLGPKKIRTLYQKLGVRTLVELEKAIEKGKVASLEGFGKKSEENILKGIGFVKKSGGRFAESQKPWVGEPFNQKISQKRRQTSSSKISSRRSEGLLPIHQNLDLWLLLLSFGESPTRTQKNPVVS